MSEASATVDTLVTAASTGDETAFADLTGRYRHELHVHCYRMLASYDDAEDAVQETFLRAWRRRATYEGRSTYRAWLYRIATNTCIDIIKSRRRMARPYDEPPLNGPATHAEHPPNVSWLQPYPDDRLDVPGSPDDEPEALAIASETIELAFLVTVQQLPPLQRAALILRDVLGWPASETASALDTTVPAIKSALQRARATLRGQLPHDRYAWTTSSSPTVEERDLVQRYVDAHQRADVAAIADLVTEDVRVTMPPNPVWIMGRESLLTFTAEVFDPTGAHFLGRWRSVPTRANRQPAVAHYVEHPDTGTTAGLDGAFRGQVLDVIRVSNGKVAEITAFDPRHFAAFGLPLILP